MERNVGMGLLIGLLAFGLPGCGIGPFSFPAGTMRQQQINALLHDPYPDDRAAPRAEGMRPREFDQPLPEPVKSQILQQTW